MQVLPRLAANDIEDGISRDAVLPRQFDLSDFAGVKAPQNLPHLILGQRCPVMRFTATRSPLTHPVGNVVFDSSQKEMRGVDAQFHIAPMTNAHTIWDFAIGNSPGVAVCSPVLIGSRRLQRSIARWHYPANPEPASIWSARSIDTRPEPIVIGFNPGPTNTGSRTESLGCPVKVKARDWLTAIFTMILGIGRLLLHRSYSFGVTPPAVSAARGHLNC